MPRLVRHTAIGPIKIDPKTLNPEKPLWICACGLSQTFPICDGTHKQCCPNEQADILYVYAPDKRTVVEQRPEPPAPSPAG